MGVPGIPPTSLCSPILAIPRFISMILFASVAENDV